VTAAGQDGEGLVLGEEIRAAVARALVPFLYSRDITGKADPAADVACDLIESHIRAAVAPDIAEAVRRECGELLSRQTDEAVAEYRRGGDPIVLFRALAAQWARGET
jgi:hypothetical protein